MELENPDSEFNIGVTDAGLCHILNGEAMRSTFAGTTRMKELQPLSADENIT